MLTDTEIKATGFRALVKALGDVQDEIIHRPFSANQSNIHNDSKLI
jgi:hypothetical protein